MVHNLLLTPVRDAIRCKDEICVVTFLPSWTGKVDLGIGSWTSNLTNACSIPAELY